MSSVTIHDIARLAGVSIGTVSKAMNNYKGVNEKTRERILAIAKESGFRANSLARGLATKQSYVIGCFFNDAINSGFLHQYFQRVIQGCKETVGNAGYDVLFFTNARFTHDRTFNDYLDRARHRSVDGVILMGMDRHDIGAREIAESDLPCMSIDMDLTGVRAGYVQSTNIEASKGVVDYLVQEGHKHIAFIGDDYHSKPGDDRLRGYESALGNHGLIVPDDWIQFGDFSIESGYLAMKKILQSATRPSAVFVAGDDMAIGAIKAIMQNGLQVPQDISIVGFDDIDNASYHRPALTTVRQEMELIGAEAGKALVQMIENASYLPPVIHVPTTLVIRDTCRSLTAKDSVYF